jgi:hypothetical protein
MPADPSGKTSAIGKEQEDLSRKDGTCADVHANLATPGPYSAATDLRPWIYIFAKYTSILLRLHQERLGEETSSSRTSSDSPLCGPNASRGDQSGGELETDEPLILQFHFDDGGTTRRLDHAAFARWENMEALLKEFEDDGTSIRELWDIREEMRIGGGDWEARVYPGMEIDVMCTSTPDSTWEDESACSSDEEESRGSWRCERQGREHWWFERWRKNVEEEGLTSGHAMQEPSPRRIWCGAASMALVCVVVLVLCMV